MIIFRKTLSSWVDREGYEGGTQYMVHCNL